LPVATPPIRDGVVVTADEHIAWVGSALDAPPMPPGAIDIPLGAAVLMPGLVNSHVHLDLTPFAGALDGHAFFAWVRAIVAGGIEALDADARSDSARWTVIDLLERGVTAFGDTSPGAAGFDAMRECGARGVAFLETFGPDPAQSETSLRDLRHCVDLARGGETSLVRIGVSPHAPYSVSDALYHGVAGYARAENLPVAVHIAESEVESLLVSHGSGPFADFLHGRRIAVSSRASSPIALLDAQRVLATQPLCIHAVRANSDDVLRLADNGAGVAHCPRSNRWFGHGEAPVAELRAKRVPVGLGTDSAASNDTLSILAEAGAAADPELTAAERVELATAGGARVLGLEDTAGTLVAGAPADLAAFVIHDVERADRDPPAYVIDRCADERAMLVVVSGVTRVRNGRATNRDDALDERMRAHMARVNAWAAASGWRAARAPF
jgi:5-methylthioadenosine/S-adenosylhomocysteine deaminase